MTHNNYDEESTVLQTPYKQERDEGTHEVLGLLGVVLFSLENKSSQVICWPRYFLGSNKDNREPGTVEHAFNPSIFRRQRQVDFCEFC